MTLTLDEYKKESPALLAQYRMASNVRAQRDALHILIVEDQLFSRRLLQQMLHPKFTLDVATSVEAGKLLFMKNAPDIVLLDIRLTDGSGHQLASFIRMIDPDSYIVMITANNSDADVHEARKNKVNGFIVKPYNKQKIFEFIHKYWEAHPDRKPEE